MKLKQTCFIAAMLATVPATAWSADLAGGLGLGTTGLSAELALALTDSLNLRAMAGGLNYGYDTTEDGIEYDGDLKLSGAGLLADWYPFGGVFHISAGAMSNGNKFDAKASGSDLDVGNNNYTVNGELNAGIEWDKFAPYVGFGWGNPVAKDKKWSFNLDLGVMYTDSPKAALTATGEVCDSNGLNCQDATTYPGFEADLAVEQANLQDSVNDAKFWPVAKISLMYKF